MYTSDAKWHTEHYGSPDKFGYKDFIPLFTAKKYDPAEWADLFTRAGAKYVVPVAEHHDGFAMWDSDITPWSAGKMGPKRDLTGELAKAVRKQNLIFGVSSHRIEHDAFAFPSPGVPNDEFDPKYAGFYGPPFKDEFNNANGSPAFQGDWLARIQELIDKYEPQMIYLDNGINGRPYDAIKLQAAAYYYNSAAKWGKEATLATKDVAYLFGSVQDFEKQGRAPKWIYNAAGWQVDDAIGSTWGYTESPQPMNVRGADSIAREMMEIASTGGNLLLNISPMGDGSIPEVQQKALLAFGEWMKRNGEALYGARPWVRMGEGPMVPAEAPGDWKGGSTAVEGPRVAAHRTPPPTEADFRFTVNGDALYAFGYRRPAAEAKIVSLASGRANVAKVSLPGSAEPLKFTQTADALRVTLPSGDAGTHMPYVLKIEGTYAAGRPGLKTLRRDRRKWIVTLALLAGGAAQAQRETRSFDRGWLFQQAEAEGASAPEFADAAWTKVDLPHDWAIAGPFAADNPSGGQGGFAPAGIGWYRKHFTLAAAAANKRVFVEFDGVMANSDVWVNGSLLGHRPNGYVSFRYELTDHLKPGENVLAVKADNSKQPSSRFYEGAGIYRHVRLLVMDPVHLGQWSTFVSASGVSANSAQVRVQTQVVNQTGAAADAALKVTLFDPAGKQAGSATLPARSVPAGQTADVEASIAVAKPDRWDTNHPALYRAKVELVNGRKTIDAEEVHFGIRDVRFEPETGFWINGRNVKLLGVALHSDIGSLGMAAPVGAWEHRLLAMRALGANAIRTAHNPVAPEFLDLCDRMGFVVMDEMFDMWTVAKNKFDYHLYFMDWYLRDTADTVRRDRNHPSVILWSAGNEIHDTPNAELAKSILGPMVKTFHENDPTRPVTQALFRPNVSHDYDDGLADMLDVVGQNYRPLEILAARKQKPSRKIVGTENTHERDQWLAVRDHADYSGMFVWAGTDYLGESRRWPMIGDASGLDDRTDAPKADALERESWWKTAPVVHIGAPGCEASTHVHRPRLRARVRAGASAGRSSPAGRSRRLRLGCGAADGIRRLDSERSRTTHGECRSLQQLR